MDDLLTPRHAADIASVGVNTLRVWARKGYVTTIRTPNGQHRYIRSEIERLGPKVKEVARHDHA